MGKSICIVQTAAGSSRELADLCARIMSDVKRFRQIIDDSMLPEMLENGGATRSVNRRLFHYYEQAHALRTCPLTGTARHGGLQHHRAISHRLPLRRHRTAELARHLKAQR